MQNHIFTKERRSVAISAAILFALVWAVLCALPSSAHAASYAMPRVDIQAELQDNGDLSVVEERVFAFSGAHSAVWWTYDSLPYGSSLEVMGVSVASADSQGNAAGSFEALPSEAFQLKWRDAGGPDVQSYSVDAPKNTVYAFFDKSDEAKVFRLEYTITAAAQKYSDIGELYWKFVGSDWAANSDDVSLTLTLPMPAGQTATAGDTVRAWGHGPLNATVEIGAQGAVSYRVPSVASGTYAEARVVFPAEWLAGVNASADNAHLSTARLDTVLKDEAKWADQANAQRAMSIGSLMLAILVSVLALLWGLRSFLRYGKELDPTFTDSYWRDVPVADEHPAVVSRIFHFDAERTEDFTATIMHLANFGALTIGKGSREAGGKRVDDYFLVRVPERELALNSEIDRMAMTFLFDTVGEGAPSLWLGSINSFAKANPEAFSEGMRTWQGRVSAHVIAGEYFEAYSDAKKGRMTLAGALLLVTCIAASVFFGNPLMVVPGAIAGIALIVVGRFMGRRTQKGADAYARCIALKRWLTEFSALDERPPEDVKVWGEFMVYALVFGVAKEALEQLRVAVPGIFAAQPYDPASAYVPWWVWYSTGASGHAAAGSGEFTSAFEQSISSSLADVQSSLSGAASSAGGFGGGFSIGGGGGFGGGGGGAR